METIRNYLESMFAALPNTENVLRARQELGAMMEDKYSELIAEGRSENEAVGIVISEFGNLEELSEELGLDEIIRNHPQDNRPILSLEETREYLNAKERTSLLIGIGVLLCIISPVGCVAGGILESRGWIAGGLAMLFACIAVAVGLFIYSGITLGKWRFVDRRTRRLDYATAAAVTNDWERARGGYTLMIVIGVICIILSVVPISIVGVLYEENLLYTAFAMVLLFVLVGIGVLLLVFAGGRKEGFKTILAQNEEGTVGGHYKDGFSRDEFDDDEVYYENRNIAKIMSVYWPIMTAIYLIISFLTWSWGTTWILWPVAAIAAGIIRKLFGTPVLEA